MSDAPDLTPPVPALPAGQTFHYTFEDYREATLAYQRRAERLEREASMNAAPATDGGRPVRRRDHWRRAVCMLVLAALWFAFGLGHGHLPGFLAPRADEYFVLRLVVPIVLYFAVTAALVRLAERAQNPGARLPPSPEERRARTAAVVGYGLMACFAAATAAIHASTTGTGDLLLHELVMLAVPWVAIFIFQYLRYVEPVRLAGGLLRAQWDASPHLHVAKTVAVDPAAFHLSDANARYELRWDGLGGIEESDNLFTLVSGSVFYMLPKRVLTGEQVALVRGVSSAAAARPTGGFPVLPPKP